MVYHEDEQFVKRKMVLSFKQCLQRVFMLLFEALDKWAIDHKLRRLELTVMSHNERAIRLYQKMGYETEGIKQDSLWVNGKYVDEYYMAKIFRQSQSTEAQ